jgi:DNA-binding protein HU-beta
MAAKTKAKAKAKAKKAAPAKKPAAKKAAPKAAKPVVVKPFAGPFPPIVTLKHLAEWTGNMHGMPKRQAIEMMTNFVTDIGRALKKGSKIRIPDLGILQVRVRPARPARMGRNPATGEQIQIKASKASKRVAFRPAKTLKQSV